MGWEQERADAGVLSRDVCRVYSEVVEKFPHLRPEILTKLLASFGELKLAKILRGALWVLGEYSLDQQGEGRRQDGARASPYRR